MSKLTGWRRIAATMWGPPNDPQIYGFLDIDATRLLRFLEDARAHGHHLTPTHLVGRAVACALEAVPDLNVRIVGTHALPRPGIDIFFITAVEGGHDLSGVMIEHVDALRAVEVGEALDARGRVLKSGEDREFSRTKRMMEALPKPLLRAALKASVLLTETLQVDVPPLALHKNPFGSAMISSVGMLDALSRLLTDHPKYTLGAVAEAIVDSMRPALWDALFETVLVPEASRPAVARVLRALGR